MDKKTIVIMILEAILFIGIIVGISHINNRNSDILEQNLQASKDRVAELVMENGSLLFEKSAYILKEKELYDQLNITKQEKKDIEKKLDDKIAYISMIEANIKTDTLEVHDTVTIIDSSAISIKFDYYDEWLQFKGGTYYKNGKSKTTIYNINVPVPLKVGLTDDFIIFVESENPYLNIIDIEGAVLDGSSLYENRPRFHAGIQAGVGVHYGLFGQKVDVGPYVGVGITWEF